MRLWFLWGVIGNTEGSSYDMRAGEDVPFTYQEACAHHVAIRCVDTYE